MGRGQEKIMGLAHTGLETVPTSGVRDGDVFAESERTEDKDVAQVRQVFGWAFED